MENPMITQPAEITLTPEATLRLKALDYATMVQPTNVDFLLQNADKIYKWLIEQS